MNAEHEAHEEIRQLFRRHVPEVQAGTVEIVSLARDIGQRSCVAVRSHDESVSAVDVCSGERGARLKAMVVELGTEYLTVLQWQASHEQFIKDAFFSPGLQVRLDSGKHQASVLVDAGIRKEIMRGKRDYQVPMFEELAGLVSRMTGWEIKISR